MYEIDFEHSDDGLIRMAGAKHAVFWIIIISKCFHAGISLDNSKDKMYQNVTFEWLVSSYRKVSTTTKNCIKTGSRKVTVLNYPKGMCFIFSKHFQITIQTRPGCFKDFKLEPPNRHTIQIYYSFFKKKKWKFVRKSIKNSMIHLLRQFIVNATHKLSFLPL